MGRRPTVFAKFFAVVVFGFFVATVAALFIGDRNVSLGMRLARLLRAPADVVRGVYAYKEISDDFSRVLLQKADVEAQLFALTKEAASGISGKHRYIRAPVFSTYPFNNRDVVVISAGNRDGVRSGMPVTVENALLFGQVENADSTHARVRTIFDAGWKIPVKIGTSGVDGLFIGGRQPRITLIAKTAALEQGQTVYVAGIGFPYGFTVGTIAQAMSDAGSAFQEATVAFPYVPSDVAEVSILLTP